MAQQTPLLTQPMLRGLIEIGFANASLPFVFPVTFGTEFKRYATEDIPMEPPLAGTYERRLVEEPEVTLALSNDRAGVQEPEEITFTLSNADSALNALIFTRPILTTLVRYHLYERETRELQANLFVGLLSAYDAELDVVHCRATRLSVAALAMVVPRSRVTAANSPLATKDDAPSGGKDSVIPLGTGVGKRIPCRRVSGPRTTAEDTGAGPVGLTDPDWHDFDAGKGNLTFDRVWASSTPIDQQDANAPVTIVYEVLHREYRGATGGKYRTALRFRTHLAANVSQLPVTADIQRVCPDVDDAVAAELKFNATFADAMTGLLATGYGGLSAANCVTGPSGAGLGAITLDGVDDYLTLPVYETAYARFQTFTVEVWIYIIPHGGPSMTLITGPGWDRVDPASAWYLEWIASSQNIRWGVFIRDIGADPENPNVFEHQILSENNTVTPGTWHHILASCDAKAGQLRLFIDRVERAGTQGAWGNAFSVAYDQRDVAIALGRSANQAVTTAWFKGKLGFFRYSGGVARDARYTARAWWMMRRNPLEFLREFFTDELGEAINPTVWDQATEDLDNALTIGGGEMQADGYITDETTAQAVIEAFLSFRDLRFWRDEDGLVCAGVAKPATEVVAHFGIGDQFNNIVAFGRRTWPSLAEAVRELPIRYRWMRDENGAVRSGSDEFDQTIKAYPAAIGRVAEALLLPFVYSHVTAEAIRQWEEKRRPARAELLEITVGHEGRRIVPDPTRLVRISIDTHGIVDADYEVVRATPHVMTRDLALSPYSANAFAWEVPDLTSLPSDPVIDTGLQMKLGANRRIRQRWLGNEGRVAFDILLVDAISLTPVADGMYHELGADARTILFEGGDATYTSANGRVTYAFDVSKVPAGVKVQAMRLVARIRSASSKRVISPIVNGKGPVPLLRFAASVNVDGIADWTPRTMEASINPLTGRPWEAADLLVCQFGVHAFGIGDLSTLELYADVGDDYPSGFSYAKLWLLGPSEEQPATPHPSSPATITQRDLFDLQAPDLITEVGRYWPFAYLYDVFGRPSALVGPTPFDLEA